MTTRPPQLTDKDARPVIVPPPIVHAKTTDERLDDLTALVGKAISRAEIAADHANRAEAAVLDLKRTTPDAEGRPGLLFWTANELVALRRKSHPTPQFYAGVMALSAFVALAVTLLR